MSRKPRLEFKGAIYHVFQRGNNKEHILCDAIEKGYFIKQIKDYMSIYNFELFAYVIMDNHYLLILRTNEAALNKIMHIASFIIIDIKEQVMFLKKDITVN